MSLRSIARASSGGSRRRQVKARLCAGALVVLALVMSIASLALAVNGASSFPDVPATHPHHAAITALAERAIIGGYDDGTFDPGKDVTRQQFAKMIVLRSVSQRHLGLRPGRERLDRTPPRG